MAGQPSGSGGFPTGALLATCRRNAYSSYRPWAGRLQCSCMTHSRNTDGDGGSVVANAAWFLAEASRILASSLDYEETLRNVAELAVPELGARWTSSKTASFAASR
jgi:hypothetical protein